MPFRRIAKWLSQSVERLNKVCVYFVYAKRTPFDNVTRLVVYGLTIVRPML